MGRPKAWLPWFGQTMVEHVVERLASAVDEVIVVTSSELDLPPLRARVVSDRTPELGPLAGIREGLSAARSDYAFVTSVDAPYLCAEFMQEMFSMGGAAAPVADDRVQVLSAVYPCDAWKTADELLARDIRRPLRLLEAVDYKPVTWSASSHVNPAALPWVGFNTPSAYLDAVREQDPDATADVELLGRAAQKSTKAQYAIPVGSLGEVLAQLPESLSLLEKGRVAPAHIVSLGGRSLVRDLAVPVGPDERVSVIDALAGG